MMRKNGTILLIAQMLIAVFIFGVGSLCLGGIEKAEAAEKYRYVDVVKKIQDYYKIRPNDILNGDGPDEYTRKARLVVIFRMQAMRELLDIVNPGNDDVKNIDALPGMMDDILEKYDKKQMLEAIKAQEPTDEMIARYKYLVEMMEAADAIDSELWLAKEFLAKRVVSENTDRWGRLKDRDEMTGRRNQISIWDAISSIGSSSNVRLGEADDYIEFGDELKSVTRKVRNEMEKQIKLDKKKHKQEKK